MSKVTSKLQVTVPKAIADEYRIKPGDDILWVASGESVRVVPAGAQVKPDVAERLKLFDQATRRQAQRAAQSPRRQGGDRGWTREDLYGRGRSR